MSLLWLKINCPLNEGRKKCPTFLITMIWVKMCGDVICSFLLHFNFQFGNIQILMILWSHFYYCKFFVHFNLKIGCQSLCTKEWGKRNGSNLKYREKNKIISVTNRQIWIFCGWQKKKKKKKLYFVSIIVAADSKMWNKLKIILFPVSCSMRMRRSRKLETIFI